MHGDVLIDISRLIARLGKGRLPTGIDRVCIAYVAHFGANAQAVVQNDRWRRILSYRDSQRLFKLLLGPPQDFSRAATQLIAVACLPPWPSQDAGGRPALYPGHAGLVSIGFAKWIRRSRQRAVHFVHDLIPLSHAEYCRAGEHQTHQQRLEVMLRAGSGLIVNSQYTFDVLASWSREHELPLLPCTVAPLAPAALLAGRPLTPLLPNPYFVMLGTIEPRKNHLLLLNVWREMVAKFGRKTPHLVIIGQRGWECENVVDMLERCEAIRPYVHEVASCPDERLAAYLTNARALLFPSFAEGFGMPLVEALMLGTPVIASDLPVFHEVSGGVADFLSPIDGPAWIEAVQDYASHSSARREAQIERLRKFRVPTWASHFAQVENLLAGLR